MLKLQPIESTEAQNFFTDSYLQSDPLQDSETRFKNALQEYDKNLQKSTHQNERTKAEILGNFFKALGFDEMVVGDSQKGNSEIDISIKKNGKVVVICEVKEQKNPEMISPKDCNKKSLHQTILYYLREKQKADNEVKFIIITNFRQFYIFRESQFDTFFRQDKRICEFFNQLQNHNPTIKIPKNEQDNNQDFYANIKEHLASDEYERFLAAEGLQALQPLFLDLDSLRDSKDYKDYKPFIKAFHRDFLLDEFDPNANNQISENFYKELLYILGLQQDKEKLKPRENNNGTLYDNILSNLQKEEDRNFENVMKLIILWLNRILFLKLIEANLVRFSSDRQLGGG